MIYLVTRSFQFRGGSIRTGATVRLTEAEMADKFVMAHVTPIEKHAKPGMLPGLNLTNGTPVKRPDERPTPAQIAKEPQEGLTEELLRAALEKLGVKGVPADATREELASLYEQAKPASAGAPHAPNRPRRGR